jgi:hypothetical protein
MGTVSVMVVSAPLNHRALLCYGAVASLNWDFWDLLDFWDFV